MIGGNIVAVLPDELKKPPRVTELSEVTLTTLGL
jgi:hypothetical protein